MNWGPPSFWILFIFWCYWIQHDKINTAFRKRTFSAKFFVCAYVRNVRRWRKPRSYVQSVIQSSELRRIEHIMKLLRTGFSPFGCYSVWRGSRQFVENAFLCRPVIVLLMVCSLFNPRTRWSCDGWVVMFPFKYTHEGRILLIT